MLFLYSTYVSLDTWKFCLVIALIFSLSSAFEVSSKIDLDSTEQCSDSSRDNSEPIVIVIKSEPEVIEHRHGFRASGWRPISGGNVNFRSPGTSMRSRNNHNPSTGQSKAIENIYIVLNGKDVTPSNADSVDCKDNICETTFSTNQTDEDNEIGSVIVTVVTKSKAFEVEDVPVIDGIRASGYDNYSPTFVPDNANAHPNFIDNHIPQGHVPRRSHLRPPSAPFYPRNFVPRQSTAWNSRIPGKTPVDDKIEPPLSKTDRVAQ